MNLHIEPSMRERLGREDLRRLEVMQEILKSVSEKPLIFKGGSALRLFLQMNFHRLSITMISEEKL
jgi:hypothetical protein